jgi:ABC-2 type transport system permease protein
MAGKILGVGAVGLTQVLIWMVTVAIYGGPAVAAVLSVSAPEGFKLPVGLLAAFAAFFLLGYVLYSTLYAAVGAAINSEQEGQQLQMIFASPLIVAIAMLMPTIQAPGSGMALGLSLFPFTAPVIMYVRIAMGAAPLWQIGLSIAIMLATIYFVLALCSRIYRVGILMYGKRPTLPELAKWLRYAGA